VLTKVQKWGNSIALRTRKAIARQISLQPNSPVELVIDGDRLVVTPLAEPVFSLDELLSAVTGENRQDEFDTGAAAGNEAW
jgi:antitoxin MazE